jgi:pteridine reductase
LAAYGLTLLLALILLTIVAIVGVVILGRRVDRKLDALADTQRKPKGDRPSAWEEAGRRAPIPRGDAGEGPESAGDLSQGDAPRRTAAVVAPGAPAELLAMAATPTNDGRRAVALVTGAAKRVGHEVALELARAGCDVLFTYNQSHNDATALSREIAALGRTATAYRADLSSIEEVGALADQLARALPHLDVLVHNASIYAPSPVEDLDPADVLRQFRINALAPLLLSARLRELLARSTLPGGGCIVAMGDIHAMERPRKDMVAYTMSKAALHEMVRCLARDLAPAVRVVGVAPGVVAWPAGGRESTAEEQVRYVRRIPLGRAGTPEDAAQVVAWLALRAPYVTGEIVRVDGGRYLT